MNKHNIIEICDYRKNKDRIRQEHLCFEFLDSLKDRIIMVNTYSKNFKDYIKCMVRDGNINKSFANNLNLQIDLMMWASYEEFSRKESK